MDEMNTEPNENEVEVKVSEHDSDMVETLHTKNRFASLVSEDDNEIQGSVATEHRLEKKELNTHKGGLCNSSTQKEVVSMLDRNGVSICALLETRIHISRINKIYKVDINATGLYYSWNQKPRGIGGLLRKLDRTMGNTNILSMFPRLHVMYKPYGILDHSPSLISFPIGKPKKSYHFKFVNNITNHPHFHDTVQLIWDNRVEGHAMYSVFQKLKKLKPPIRKLGQQLGNPSHKVEALRIELERAQEQLDRDPDNEEISVEHAVYLEEFTKALCEEECLLRQKEKLYWLKEGDRNTKYYHKVIKERQNRNKINSIIDGDSVEHGADKIPDIVIAHFSDFPGKARVVDPVVSPNDLFSNTLTNEDANWMVRPIEDEEIKHAIFDIGNDKAPGPDGFTSTFFKKAWHIVGIEVCKAVKEFFLNGQLLQAVNHTILALLPNVEVPNTMKDFCPISCCNVIYKCIKKTIVTRMAPSLHKLVDMNQSTFITGRAITDNILLSQELMQGYTRKHRSPRCALKVDIQKVYDTVNWNFLEQILWGFGFHHRMIQWIMKCVSTTSFSIRINGENKGYFMWKKGLRQGDPMSPYLFTLIMEVFNLMIKRRIQQSPKHKYQWRCGKQKLTHLYFVDGLLIFSHGSIQAIQVVKDSLQEFQANILGFEEAKLPVRYLGIPLIGTRMLVKDCNKLVQQVKARVQNWKHRALSFAGRLQLINSVLQSLQVYWCSVLLLPKTTINDIKKVFKGFLWNGGYLKKGSANIAWKMVCRPKDEGGLGICNLQTWNEALLYRQIWRLFTTKNSLWVDWVKIHHLRKQTFWEVKRKDLEGFSWSNMLSLRDKIWKHIWRILGDGTSINLWYDNWHAGGPLINIITEDERNMHGLSNDFTLHQFCSNHSSWWPWGWGFRFPIIQLQGLLSLQINKDDGVYWWDLEGRKVKFSRTQVWKDIRIASPVVSWYKVVWFKLNIPSHAFILWLAIHDRLMTQERMQI
ncbi:unnamed protein product [Lactuca virosa]|uniref:Reverse transcriptase domain-containing protein n=1 Tax=Lactuca virosa TaxID=75947 RepID=A0AAU9PTM4_9ASTR|nr:unnamed protein product [Lactuca virosa]